LLKPEYFDRELHKLAAQSIYKVYLSNKELPNKVSILHTLSERLQKKIKVKDEVQKKKFILKPVQKLIRRIFNRAEGSTKYVKEETLRFCRVQELRRSYYEAAENLEMDSDPEKSTAFINQRIRNLSTLEQGGLNFSKTIESLPEMLKRDKGRCATTGFPRIDTWMDGGMDPGTLTVFIAPAKFGKSMALVNVGFANLLRGRKVAHFTCEISEKKIAKRYAARISRVKSIEKCPNKTIRRVNKFFKLHGGELRIKGYPTKTATVETIKSYLYGLQNRDDFKPDVIIVDYGDLLRSGAYAKDKDGSSERFIQGDVFEGLRAMAQEFDCVVVTASQCNRAAATKPIIRMEDIAESYAKCQVADHILAICGTEEERKVHRLRLFFAGSREAMTERTSRVKFNWRIAYMAEVKFKKEAA
jgi:replicative DNA helicase